MVSIDGGEDLVKLVGRGARCSMRCRRLTRLAVHQKTGERRLMLDIANWRRRRRDDCRPSAKVAKAGPGSGGAKSSHR